MLKYKFEFYKSMNKKKVVITFGLVTMLVLAAIAIEAASSYRMPAKYKGLAKGVDKKEALKLKPSLCQSFGCGKWHTVVGDKTTKKSYDCRCQIPADMKKQNAVCFNSVANAKRASPGYRMEVCRR